MFFFAIGAAFGCFFGMERAMMRIARENGHAGRYAGCRSMAEARRRGFRPGPRCGERRAYAYAPARSR